jgi:uncharacterized protein
VWCCSAPGRAAMRVRIRITTSVFLKDLTDRWEEIDRIIPVVTDIVDDTGAVIHAMPYQAGSYQDRTSLTREIRREGVDL